MLPKMGRLWSNRSFKKISIIYRAELTASETTIIIWWRGVILVEWRRFCVGVFLFVPQILTKGFRGSHEFLPWKIFTDFPTKWREKPEAALNYTLWNFYLPMKKQTNYNFSNTFWLYKVVFKNGNVGGLEKDICIIHCTQGPNLHNTFSIFWIWVLYGIFQLHESLTSKYEKTFCK